MYDHLKQTWNHFWHWLTLVPVVLDILFIMSFGFAFEFIRSKLEQRLAAVMTIIAQSPFQVVSGEYNFSGLLERLHELPGFTAQYQGILVDVAVLLVFIFVLWVVFQGISWWLCYKLHGRNVEFKHFFSKFFAKTLGYYVLFVIAVILTVRSAISTTLLESPTAGLAVYNYLFQFISLLLIFAFLSYAKIDSNIINIWKDYTTVLFMYATVIGLYLIGHFILYGVALINYTAMIVVGVVFFMPLLVYLKMFMVHALNETD